MRDELPAGCPAEADLLPAGGPAEAMLSVLVSLDALPVGGPTEAAVPLMLMGFFVGTATLSAFDGVAFLVGAVSIGDVVSIGDAGDGESTSEHGLGLNSTHDIRLIASIWSSSMSAMFNTGYSLAGSFLAFVGSDPSLELVDSFLERFCHALFPALVPFMVHSENRYEW